MGVVLTWGLIAALTMMGVQKLRRAPKLINVQWYIDDEGEMHQTVKPELAEELPE